MKKISTAMNQDWDGRLLEDLLSHDPSLQEGMSVWKFLEHISSGRLLRITSVDTFSLTLDDVFQEMYHNILKKVMLVLPLQWIHSAKYEMATL